MQADYVHKDSMTLEEKPQVFTRWVDPTIMELKQENQELKLELSGYRQAILEDKDMLGLKEENEELKNQLEEKNKPQIFIDTQDIEERYAEGLYQDYLEEENKQLKKDIKNIIKILNKNCDDLEATDEEFDSLDRWQGLQVVELEQGSDSNVKD